MIDVVSRELVEIVDIEVVVNGVDDEGVIVIGGVFITTGLS